MFPPIIVFIMRPAVIPCACARSCVHARAPTLPRQSEGMEMKSIGRLRIPLKTSALCLRVRLIVQFSVPSFRVPSSPPPPHLLLHLPLLVSPSQTYDQFFLLPRLFACCLLLPSLGVSWGSAFYEVGGLFS